MTSSGLFDAMSAIDDAALHEEVFGLLEASRNYSRDCAPATDYESAFSIQLTMHLASYSAACIAWFASQGITPNA
ncbi:hypothetical protein [Paraburkholderia sp. BL17N1]|uniref:hypothetical protein n=1 Tax=Paraburkholderia sp. BL17N1 TaxID=1938798 RepID=UPI000EB2C1A7|nr:hypothetical protein [Paraburkholderia sp. BL17N1]RKR46336.1 hypothetical protein B0G82_4019 [Paraburkholderia sp. BL17N1]